jgi:Lrp/AsnC family leucine-responsive transcriptional regulator
MDATDLEIVRLLQANARLTHEQIGREVHLSRPAVHERVRRLEEAGILRGYGARVDWAAIGLPLMAFVWVRTTAPHTPVAQSIMGLSFETAVVEECSRVAGEWCALLRTRSASTQALEELLDAIVSLPGVASTRTTVVLSTLDAADQQASAERERMPDASGVAGAITTFVPRPTRRAG